MIRIHLCELFSLTRTNNNNAVVNDVVTRGNNMDNNSSSSNNNNCISINLLRTQQLISLEKQLNTMIDEEGAMERIKGTPLPLVYVTHLRTWLVLFLLSMPYFWEPSLGYATIPV